MFKYPKVLSELETLQYAIAGRSVARLGDGELRIALGGSAPSQGPNKLLGFELRNMLGKPAKSLVCLPPLMTDNPVMWFWKTYTQDKYTALYQKGREFGSTWITRPDCAPWIDNDNYFDLIKTLWVGKDIVFVHGDDRSLRVDQLEDARSIRHVLGTTKNAYLQIDRIEEEIGKPTGTVLMCLGATATVLAERLEQKGVHAVDLGHVGMFMRRRAKRNV